MENLTPINSEKVSSLSTPTPARQLFIPVLVGVALVAMGVFAYFQFFASSKIASNEQVTAGVDVQNTSGTDDAVDPVYQADYDEGYSAGYADGRSESGEFYDSYQEPATPERQGGYFEGYYAGFLRGCDEGDFDCSEIEQYRTDYESGYDAGYADGYAETGEFFDSYAEPLDESRQQSYLTGYWDGFLVGCEDGNFDCSEVQTHRDIYDAAFDVGYTDGYSDTGEFLDNYTSPTDDSFVSTYTEGYFDGFLGGCRDGDFDCSDIATYREELNAQEAADATRTPSDVH